MVTFGPILHRFWIRRLIGWNCIFFILLSYSAPPLHIFPLEFRGEVKRQEESWSYSVVNVAW